MTRGRYIVLEGPKGVGKSTQAMILESTLKSARIPVKLISEDDDQDDPSLLAIAELFSSTGHIFNNRTRLLLHNAARSRSLDLIKTQVDNGIVCIADQNYLTTLTMQYYGLHSVDNYENLNQIINFAAYNIEPDLTIVLDAEVSTLSEHIKAYAKEDIIKIYDESLLERLRAGYLWEAKERGYQIVQTLGSKEAIFNVIWDYITENLTHEVSSPPIATVTPNHIDSVGEILEQRSNTERQPIQIPSPKPVQAASRLVVNNEANSQTTVNSTNKHDTLGRIITNTKGNIFGFTSILSPETIGHILSYATSKQSAFRATLLSDYCAADKESRRKLLIESQSNDYQRTLSNIGRYIVIERISNLAVGQIEKLGFEMLYQITPVEIMIKNRQANKNNFYIPSELGIKIKKQFQQNIEQIIGLRKKIVDQIIDFLSKSQDHNNKKIQKSTLEEYRSRAVMVTKPLIPVAGFMSIALYESINDLGQLADNLSHGITQEFQMLAEELQRELQKLLIDNNDELSESKLNNYNSKNPIRSQNSDLVSKYLPKVKVDADDSLTLNQYSPRNEINLIDDLLYVHADISGQTLRKVTDKIPYDKKLELYTSELESLLTQNKNNISVLDKLVYEFDVITDYAILCELHREKIIKNINWQELTPRHGFAIPLLVDDAGALEDFEQAFAICLNLYSSLQTDHLQFAQYATLLGHKQRARLMLSGADIMQIYKFCQQSETYPGMHDLLQKICDRIAEVHPIFFELISK